MSCLEGTNFLVWIAKKERHSPICLGGKDGGFSITAYYNDSEEIAGVLVYKETELVGTVGWIPADVFQEELEHALDHV